MKFVATALFLFFFSQIETGDYFLRFTPVPVGSAK